MQLKKIVGAGALAVLMAGSSIAFAATLADYPQPYVTSDGASDFLVVVGAAAAPSDVVGAIDVAARLGSETFTNVAVGGSVGGVTVSGEGKAVSTSNTNIYLGDTLGKSGLRNTMTKDEMPDLLADGTVVDANGTSYKYQQFIYLTPSDTSGTSAFRLQYDKPGAGGTEDPSYTIGKDITTSPSASTYLYRTQVTFDKELPKSTAIGESIELFGRAFTIHSETNLALSNPKLVLAGGSDKIVLGGGEKSTATVSGKTYDITFVGASDATTAVVKIGSEQKSVAKGVTSKIGGLDVYVDDVFRLSTDDQKQNSVSLLLGAEKLILQNGNKVKAGDNEDSVDGTSVAITASNDALSSLTVYTSAQKSTADFVKKGGSYEDPLWKSFNLAFPSTSPDAMNGDKMTVQNSGDNLMQVTFTDYRGNAGTLNFAYKSQSTDTTFSLADSNGDTIHVLENASVSQDQYIVVDAGQFAHIYEVTNVDADGSSSASIDLSDVMSGTTLKVTLGTDNADQKVIDGQSYYFEGTAATTMRVTWGSGAGRNETGNFISVFPVVETSKKARFALTTPNVMVPLRNGQKINLPTGALTVNYNGTHLNFTSTAREDGTAAACSGGVCADTADTQTATIRTDTSDSTGNVTLGRTSTGALRYKFDASGTGWANVTVMGDSDDAALTQPAVLLVEEKDDGGDEYSVVLPVSTETSGSNNVAKADTPRFTYAATGVTLGSNSDITRYVDIWGTLVERNSNGQDIVTVWYPDDQVAADVFVLADGATTTTTTGASGSTVKQAVPVKTAVARLDSEVGSTEKNTKNLVLVGGPAVNSLVAELAAAGSTWSVQTYRDEGAGTAILQHVEDAFASGKSALVVAGHSASDTRAATAVLLKFDENTDKLKGTLAKLKNGVWTTESA
jgi:hypothetical protein